MTVSSSVNTAHYVPNGTTTVFSVPFYFLEDSDLVVQLLGANGTVSTQLLNSDYTVTGAGNEAGGSVAFAAAPSGVTYTKVSISRQVPATQDTSYPPNTPFPASSHEQALDKLTMLVQQIMQQLGYTSGLSTASALSGVNPQLPDPAASNLIGWNAAGTALVNAGTGGLGVGSVADINVATGAAIESSKLAFLQAGTGAVSRGIQSVLRDRVSVKDFGAKGDGATDDTAAIEAAIAFCSTAGNPRVIHFPVGTYIVTSGFTINHPIRFVGDGAGGAAFVNWPAESNSCIRYTGAAGGVLFQFTNVNWGNCGMEGLWLDCNNLANTGVVLDGVAGANFSRVKIDKFPVCGMKLTGTTMTCSWNTFDCVFFNSGSQTSGTKAALWLSGVTGGGNACHNTFVNTGINLAGSFHGVYLGGCDNNTFVTTYIYSVAGSTGKGVYCDFSENGVTSAFPTGNVFVHLEAEPGYYEAAASPARSIGSAPSAVIYGYQLDNGEPLPVSADGALVPLVDNYGVAIQARRRSTSTTVTSGTSIAFANFDTVFLDYASATTVTDLTGSSKGDRVCLYQQSGSAAVTLKDSAGSGIATMYLKGLLDVTLAANQCVFLIQTGNGWLEIGRNF